MRSWLSKMWSKPAITIKPAPDHVIEPNASPVSMSVSVDQIAPQAPADPQIATTTVYQDRLRQEAERFAQELDVNALPAIFHYWSNKFLRPMLEEFGYAHPEDFFAKAILAQAQTLRRPVSVISIGAGNCDAEVRIAKALCAAGLTDFTIECLDLTEAMLARGRALAEAEGVGAHLQFTSADFNRWTPTRTYEVVMANQSLHHVLDLEHLFDAIHAAIGRDGIFVTSDMIGRNGHQRWPEARALLDGFWRELPPRYRYNVLLKRQEDEFLDWDCSVEGFEGIRAQDILPLLNERFGFEFFLAFGNLVSPFVDRCFGHHFDVNQDWDRDFIDRVHAADEAAIQRGEITPTHMLAILRADRHGAMRCSRGLQPGACIRRPRPAVAELT